MRRVRLRLASAHGGGVSIPGPRDGLLVRAAEAVRREALRRVPHEHGAVRAARRDDGRARVERGARDGQPVSVERVRIGIDQTALRLEADRLDEAMAWSRSEIAEAERATDAPRVRELMERERDLGAKRKVLDRRLMASGVMTAGKGGLR